MAIFTGYSVSLEKEMEYCEELSRILASEARSQEYESTLSISFSRPSAAILVVQLRSVSGNEHFPETRGLICNFKSQPVAYRAPPPS